MTDQRFYEITLAGNSHECVLTYKLENHRPAQIWSQLIKNCKVENLRSSLDPWRGIYRSWGEKIVELKKLIRELNEWLPNKIPYEWDDLNPQESLNRLHIHFPEEEKNEKETSRRFQLSRYNDLIHEMEGQLKIRKRGREMMTLLLCPDDTERVILVESDFKHFTTKYTFGDLKLHYCHVGRHPWEVFVSQDLNVPKDQIIPQYEISAYHTLTFFDTVLTFEDFKKFYNSSQITWPYALENQKLAVGYINLGKLVYVDHKEYNRVEAFIKVRKCDKIINWQII